MEILRNIAPFITLIIVVALFIIAIAAIYVKAPPDTAVIITGSWKKPRILIGRAGIRIPLLERSDCLTLKQIPVFISTNCLTSDFIRIEVNAIISIQISDDENMLQLAAKSLLNKGSYEISIFLKDILKGTIKQSIRNKALKAIYQGRESTEIDIYNNSKHAMSNFGINVLSCYILNISDSKHLIKKLAAVNYYKIKKEAAIAKAESERDIKIAQKKASIETTTAKKQKEGSCEKIILKK